VPHSYGRFLVPKGFVAIDGTSLTICEVGTGGVGSVGVGSSNITSSWFTIMLVAHTQQHVIFPYKMIGETVNVEVDVLGKLVESTLRGTIDTLLHRIEVLEQQYLQVLAHQQRAPLPLPLTAQSGVSRAHSGVSRAHSDVSRVHSTHSTHSGVSSTHSGHSTPLTSEDKDSRGDRLLSATTITTITNRAIALEKNRSSKKWSEEDDRRLIWAKEQVKNNDWIQIASLVANNKTPKQCLHRYRALNPSIKHMLWTAEVSDDDDDYYYYYCDCIVSYSTLYYYYYYYYCIT
jgi:hypothetical protein